MERIRLKDASGNNAGRGNNLLPHLEKIYFR